ncbi:MAG: pilus assembly protein [Hyphomicrobiales bacterium]|nr:pilus assembly protein [Hyphomicrobiales bacterium]
MFSFRSSALQLILPPAALLLGMVLAFHPAHAAESIVVKLDQAKIIQLPEGTSTVIVGNPGVADVTLLKKKGRMILTAKGFGETNMLALDAQGNSIGESIVRVVAADNSLIVQRGLERESYSCSPRCQPTVTLGDTPRYMSEAAGQVQQRNTFSAPPAR